MKQLLIAFLATGVCGFQASAQDKNEEKHVMRVVIKTDDNGTETVVDTTINLNELTDRIEAIDFDAVIEELAEDIDGGWKDVAEKLQDIELDMTVNGKHHELKSVEDIAEWLGKAMEGVHYEYIIDDDENIFIHDSGKNGSSRVKVIVDEDSEDGIFVQEDRVSVDLDENGNGNIIVRSTGSDGENDDVNVWIEEDGNVVVNGGNGSAKAKVKVMKMEDGNLFFSEDDADDIDVKVITDDSGNSESTVMIKKIVRAEDRDFKNAPALPNGLTLQVYPNPNNGQFQLTFRNDKKLRSSAVVYDSKGTEVYRFLIGKIDGLKKMNLDLSHLRSGTYILKLEQGNNTASEQFIIR